MGVAAYNRGTKAIEADIARGDRAAEFCLMADLNDLPKYQGASAPFGDVHFVYSHNGWWAECPVTGFGYHYPTLREAVRNWRVTVHSHVNGTWIASPTARRL